jgi:holo-[acyl-carrier protein] synthase
MLVGIGVDIVEIERVERLLDRFGERIARRLLTAQELAQFAARGSPPRFLASRFAAKEAAAKALGTGIAQGVGFHGIEVVNADSGKPGLNLLAGAAAQATRLGVGATHLSLSDEKHYCVAMVVLETG